MGPNRTPPPHISLVDPPVTYRWDNTIEEEMLFFQMNIAHRIAEMSDKAALVFSLGALEWTLWRLLPGDTAFQFLDAAWAALTDWRYLKSFYIPNPDLEPSIAGPLALSFEALQTSFTEARNGRPFIHNPIIISKVALHVCGQPHNFNAWQRQIIKRLIHISRPIARSLLNPAYIPSPAKDQEQIADYLAGLNWQTNPFLHKI